MGRRRKDKKGTASVFLALILSSIVLIQCTYYSLVCDLDRKMTICRAVSAQTESFLAEYDRTLFSVYGIYAFDISEVDSDVFDYVLEANGISNGDTLAVSGVNTFDTEDLRRAISVYYSYRTPAVALNSFLDCFSGVLESTELSELTGALRQFGSSEAASFLIDIIQRTAEVTSTLASLAEELDIPDLSEKLEMFGELMEQLDDLDSGVPDPSGGFDDDAISYGAQAVNIAITLFGTGSDVIEGIAFHPFAVHYAAYDFDCSIGPHETINGTSFDCIHEGISPDVEYILTGHTGSLAQYEVNLRVYGLMVARSVIDVLTDPEKREIAEGVAEILEAVVVALSLGSVQLPSSVYLFLVSYLYAKIAAIPDYLKIMQGDKITLISSGGTDILQVGYREILYMYMNLVSDSQLLTRMHEILSRDFPDYVCGITVETSYKGEIISFERGYAMYE